MHPHKFGVDAGVALMIGKVGKSGGGSEDLLLIPDANVVGVGPGKNDETGTKRPRPVRHGAELVERDDRVARGNFAAAICAGGGGGRGVLWMLEKVWGSFSVEP